MSKPIIFFFFEILETKKKNLYRFGDFFTVNFFLNFWIALGSPIFDYYLDIIKKGNVVVFRG